MVKSFKFVFDGAKFINWRMFEENIFCEKLAVNHCAVTV